MPSQGNSRKIESPFLDEELFVGETVQQWERRLNALHEENPFRQAFEHGLSYDVEPVFARPEADRAELDEGEADIFEDEGWGDVEVSEAGEDQLVEPWESEISRTTSTYIKWIQQSLNRILGARLAIDGIIGARTGNAIRSFQQRQGLTADGTVDSVTEAALIAAGAGRPPTQIRPAVATPPIRVTTDFIPVAVENPGGGRIQDKRDPDPTDLVTIRGFGGKRLQLHQLAAKAYDALVHSARQDGIQEPLLLANSGYRSTRRQAELFRAAVVRYGSEREARKWVAPPGKSAHHAGRAIDFYLGEKTPVAMWQHCAVNQLTCG